MQKEINLYSEQLKDAYEGDPWFGRSVKVLLSEVDESIALKKLNGQHSILELVWHMITWREFTIHCIQPSPNQNLKSFEELDWRELDHTNRLLWAEGIKRLDETHDELLKALQKADDSILEQIVGERNYNFRKLLAGIIQHDVYHIGQIAYINKALKNA
ncbi:MAG: DinB family protein [Chitinophagaceae bacterium]|nr:MAG: DinB family protein [Chitinophagaceae bacterium]